MSAEVTAVVVTHNSAGVIDTALDSLGASVQTIAIEVVVVDNGSTDDTVARVERRGDCRVVRAANDGYAAGINAGVLAAEGTGPILVLNPDTVCDPGAVVALADAAARHHAIAVPRIVGADGTTSRSQRRFPTLARALGLGFTDHPALTEIVSAPEAYATAHPVDWATGAVMLVPRACHAALGGWDESFFLYSEETDFCLRARDAGWSTWFEPRAVVRHDEGGSGRNATLYAMQIVNRVRLYRRRTGPLRGAAFFALAVLREASRVARGDAQARVATAALLRPRRRPPQLGAAGHLVPR